MLLKLKLFIVYYKLGIVMLGLFKFCLFLNLRKFNLFLGQGGIFCVFCIFKIYLFVIIIDNDGSSFGSLYFERENDFGFVFSESIQLYIVFILLVV